MCTRIVLSASTTVIAFLLVLLGLVALADPEGRGGGIAGACLLAALGFLLCNFPIWLLRRSKA